MKQGKVCFVKPARIRAFAGIFFLWYTALPAVARGFTDAATAPYETPSGSSCVLTVVNGTGAGLYASGATVGIVASPAPAGQVFDKWVVGTGAGGITKSDVLGIMEKVADWQIAHTAGDNPRNWVMGTWYTGLMALNGLSPSSRFRDHMMARGTTNEWAIGSDYDPNNQYCADNHVAPQAYAEMYFLYTNTAMIGPLQAAFDYVLATPATGSLAWQGYTQTGTARWRWCDALYMAPPAWLQLTAATGDDKYKSFMTNEWWQVSDYLYDTNAHLYYRDSTYFTQTEPNGQKKFWSRGNGWVMGGLVRVLQNLPPDEPTRPRFIAQLQEMGTKIASILPADGLWHPSLLDPVSYPNREASGSGFHLYGITYAVNNGIMDRTTYEPLIMRVWTNLTACVDSAGRLSHVQPIGSDPVSFSQDQTAPYGVGSFLLAGSEVHKLVPATTTVPIADIHAPSTTLTMTATNVTVIATYKPAPALLRVGLDCYHNAETIGADASQHYRWEGSTLGGYSQLGTLVQALGGTTTNITAAFSPATLANIDVLIVVDPDTAAEAASPAYISAAEADAALAWVRNGGVLILLGNNASNCEFTNFNVLAEKFGVTFNQDTAAATGTIGSLPANTFFAGCSNVHIVGMCTLGLISPAVAQFTSDGQVVMATSAVGKGAVFALGDPVWYNEYIGTADNMTFASNVFRWAQTQASGTPDAPTGWAPGTSLAPVTNGYAEYGLNVANYQKSSLVTHDNEQFLAFYAPVRSGETYPRVTLAKRMLGTTSWTVQSTDFIPYSKTDGHDTISMGVDGEGIVHLSWGLHNNQVNYARGAAHGSLAVSMQSLAPTAGSVTYPRFTLLPNGDLLYDYRDGGGSGNANHHLQRWSLASHTWTSVNGPNVPFISGQTTAGIITPNGDNRNPYINDIVLDSQTNLVTTFCWCEDWASVDYRHDQLYARSPDFGVTWLKLDGSAYALPITIANADLAWSIPTNHVLMNQTSMCVDQNDRPVIATWWAPNGSGTPAQIFVIWHNGTNWQSKQLTSRITNTTGMPDQGGNWPSRPLVVCDKNNSLFLITCDTEWGGKPQLFWCTDPTRQAWQQTDLTSDSLGCMANWEPVYDRALWDRESKLDLFYQKLPGTATGTLVSVLEFDSVRFLGAPTVANGTVTDILDTTATLNGMLMATGTAATTVFAFWGVTDRGLTTEGWDGATSLGVQTVGPLSVGVTSLTGGTNYYFRFLASNENDAVWGEPAGRFKTASVPALNNGAGADQFGPTYARLNGVLTRGGNAEIAIYWGEADGATNASAWSNTVVIGRCVEGSFSTNITGLVTNTTYFYRCFASNGVGTAWADTSATFETATGPITVSIDFASAGGSYSGRAAAPTDGTVWNVIDATGTFSALSNSWGAITPFSIVVPGGGSFSASATRSAPGEPCMALMIDSWGKWDAGGHAAGSFVLSGLDPSRTYTLYLYGNPDTVAWNYPYGNFGKFIVDGVTKEISRGDPGKAEHALTLGYDYVVYANVNPTPGGSITVTVMNPADKLVALISGLQLVETAASTPAEPVATAATAVSTTDFSANWNASAGATNYLLDVATDSGFAAYVDGYSNRVTGNATTHSVTGLSAATAYYYRVRAQNAAGISPYSNTIETRTLAPDAPAAPVATAATNVTPSSLYANWTASAGTTNYLLDVATDSGFTACVSGYRNRATGNVMTYRVTGLTAETTYYYRLRAQNAYGDSTNSNMIVTNTAGHGPTTVSIDFASGGGSYSGLAAAPTDGTVWNVINAAGTRSGLSNSWGVVTAFSVIIPDGPGFAGTSVHSSPGEPCPALMSDHLSRWYGPSPTVGNFALTLAGLNSSRTYDLYLYGFTETVGWLAPYGRRARFSVGGMERETERSVAVSGEHVLTLNHDYLVFSNQTPTASGEIVITVMTPTSGTIDTAFINGLQLVEKRPPSKGFLLQIR